MIQEVFFILAKLTPLENSDIKSNFATTGLLFIFRLVPVAACFRSSLRFCLSVSARLDFRIFMFRSPMLDCRLETSEVGVS